VITKSIQDSLKPIFHLENEPPGGTGDGKYGKNISKMAISPLLNQVQG